MSGCSPLLMISHGLSCRRKLQFKPPTGESWGVYLQKEAAGQAPAAPDETPQVFVVMRARGSFCRNRLQAKCLSDEMLWASCRKKLQAKRLPEPTLQDRVQMHLLLAKVLTATNKLPEATKVG